MLIRSLGALTVALMIGGLVLAEESTGRVTKIEDGSITISIGGGFGGGGKGKGKAEEKTFKVAKDIKVSRVAGKDKEPVKLTLAELKTAVKVTNVFVTITHDGDNGSEIKVGGFGIGGGGKGKGKGKGKDKDK